MDTTYENVCNLSIERAQSHTVNLLSKRGVKIERTDTSFTSLSIPVVVLGIQGQLYSRDNWVGINPFVFISGIHFCFEWITANSTRVVVRVNRLRSYMWVAFWATCG